MWFKKKNLITINSCVIYKQIVDTFNRKKYRLIINIMYSYSTRTYNNIATKNIYSNKQIKVYFPKINQKNHVYRIRV